MQNNRRDCKSNNGMAFARHQCRLVLLSMLLSVGWGCGDKRVNPDQPMFSNMGGVAEISNKYQGTHGGKRPNDLAEFKQFAAERGGFTLNRIGVKDVEELLISERDGQPLVLLFGKDMLKHDDDQIIGYEQTGVGGSRMVGLQSGGAVLLSDSEFDEIKK